jgi:hypothetical protein
VTTMPALTRIKVVLDVAASLSMTLVACLLSWMVLFSGGRSTGKTIESYKVGDRFLAPPELNLKTAASTLVVYVRSGCHYCTESMGFYKRLVTTSPRRARVVVMGMEEQRTLDGYLSNNGLRPDQVISVAPGSLPMRATPTLVLVSSDAKVQRVWVGKLRSDSDENDVINSTR